MGNCKGHVISYFCQMRFFLLFRIDKLYPILGSIFSRAKPIRIKSIKIKHGFNKIKGHLRGRSFGGFGGFCKIKSPP